MHWLTINLAVFVPRQSWLVWIASEYDLTLAEIYAALAYYFDNRLEIDKDIESRRNEMCIW